ncbi:immunoglobulin-like domain-containing protein [Listeria grandensis]|uniref:immunoglobulin-like domain-containing protein n=1 Tax=Listeria grandensis TaxID=1494963 RepID=UPI00131EF8C0|nr:immunoglobulin-like domain-containing protein [Listeria grandensis]
MLSTAPFIAGAEEKIINPTEEKQQEDVQTPELVEQKVDGATDNDKTEDDSTKEDKALNPFSELKTENSEKKENETTVNEAKSATDPAPKSQRDQRAAISVSTFAQFRDAFANDQIREITLTNGFSFTGNITGVRNSNLTVYGNNQTINMGSYYIHSLANRGMRLTLENLNTRGGRFGESYAAISYDNYGHVTLRNVTHQGGEYVLAEGGITLGGNVNARITDRQNLSNSISVWGTKAPIGGGGPFIVEEGANVNISQETGNVYQGSMLLGMATQFVIRKNAVFNMQAINSSRTTPPYGDALIVSRSTITPVIESGAEMNLYTGISGLRGIQSNFSGINVQPGAKLNINTNGGTGIYNSARTTLNFAGDIDIKNSAATGQTIYAAAGSSMIFGGQDIGARSKGSLASTPDMQWNNVSGSASFSGNNTATNSTTNASFNSQFRLQNVNWLTSKTATGIENTTINGLTTASTVATGTAEPNSIVEIKANGTVINTGVANGNGTYSISIPLQTVGTTVTAQASLNGQVSNIAETVVRAANIPVGTIRPDVYSTGSSSITGSYTGDVTRAELFVNGQPISQGGAFANGSFSYYVNSSRINLSDNVVLVAYSADGTELDRRTVIVVSGVTGSLWPDDYRLGAASITGSFSGDINFARLVINGLPTNHWGGNFNPANGTFSFYVAPNLIGAGDLVTIQGFNSSDLSTVIDEVPVQVIVQGTIAPNDYRVGDSNIIGTYTGDVVRTQLIVNGQDVNIGGTFANGNFTHFVPAGRIQAGANVELVAFDAAGRELDRQTVRVIANTQGTITPADYRLGDANITGTYTGDVVRAELIVNSNRVNIGGTFVNGTFTYFVPAGRIQAGANVELVAFDAAGKELDRKPVRVTANTQGTITPADYRLGDANITGTYTGDVVRAELIVNSNRVNIGGTFVNGTFTHFVPAGRIQAGANVELVAFDATGRELDRKPVRIANTQGTITPDAFRVVQSNSNITGTFTGDVASARLIVNENVVPPGGGGTFNPDGTFSFFVRTGTIRVGDRVVLIAFDSAGRELQRQTVSIVNTQGTITANDYKVGDANITGNYTGDVTSARLMVNERVVTPGGGTFNPDGTFSYFVQAGVIQAGDTVTLVAMDANGRELNQTNVRVNPNIQGTITLNNYTAGGANLTGTFTGDIARGRITVNSVVGMWGGDFNPNGTFTYYVGNLGLTAGDRVTLTGFSLDHTELDDSTITVQ